MHADPAEVTLTQYRIKRLLWSLEEAVNDASRGLGIKTPSEIAGEPLDSLATAECAPNLIRELMRLAEHVQSMPPRAS